MTTVFLSGSRALSRLNDVIRQRLDNMIENELDIVVGDANGADKAMQGYLAERGYENVVVFHVNGVCRNNIGNWKTQAVVAHSQLSGRDLYAQKDKEMARLADVGLVLWDGKSAGSIHNVFELLKHKKKVVVYYGPEKAFFNITTPPDANELLAKCDPTDVEVLKKKLSIAKSMRELEEAKQTTFAI